MCLNLHPDFIITDCVFHYCFGIIGPGDMHLKNYNIQIYTVLFNQQKSMKINTYVFLFRPQKLSLHLFTILKGKFCGKKTVKSLLGHTFETISDTWYFFFRSKILLQKTFIAYQANFFFFALRKELSFMFSNLRCISIMRMR